MRKPGESKNTVSAKLTALRIKKGYSQWDLVREFELLGYPITQNMISKMERGVRKVTDIEIRAYMEVFRVSSEYILALDDEEEDN